MIKEQPDIDTLESGLGDILKSPGDNGTLEMIVVRPQKKERETPDECLLTRVGGVDGDHWSKGCWKKLHDGSPDPAVQVAIMNSRSLNLVASSITRWPLAGDNLIVDMDLSTQNLKPGQRLSLGTAILEITAVPHTGCKYFRDRFGIDALKFVSTKDAMALRLRGVYARVIRDGVVRVGNVMTKLPD